MAFSYNPRIITNGLVLYLDAANTRSYPGSGTTWSDLSRSGNNGTLVNGPTFNSGNAGSIVFDGVDDYVITPTNTALGTGQFAIDVWFKPNGAQALNSTLICIAAASSITNWQISFQSNTLLFDVNPLIISTYTASTSWTNATVVRETTASNGTKIYINGIINVSGTINNDFSQIAGYRIGMNRGSNAWYNGNIANIKVYNRALSSTEILQNYNATKTRFGL